MRIYNENEKVIVIGRKYIKIYCSKTYSKYVNWVWDATRFWNHFLIAESYNLKKEEIARIKEEIKDKTFSEIVEICEKEWYYI